ncbi:hypothetical protein EI94DRAFT_1814033 [Lactarius quietus]|nr:hypothetical protein EI94DRAFT_1814033 [Lactarius quietus]
MSTEDFDLNKNVDNSEMSDDSFLDIQPIIPLSTSQIDNVELQKVLKETQLNFQRLKVKYKDLRTKYEVLKSSSKSASVKKGRKSVGVDDKEITLTGGRFAFAYELWVDGAILELERPSGVDPLSNQRYSETSTEKLAISEELYSSPSLHLQDALANERRHPSFKKTFLQQVKQERANIVYTTCSIAGELFSLNPTYFCAKFDRAEIPELQRLLQDPDKPEKYPVLAPMIFPNRDCSNYKNVLAVEELPKFLRTILLGISSLGGGDPAGRRASKASLWGLTKTTPGMITLAATVVL